MKKLKLCLAARTEGLRSAPGETVMRKAGQSYIVLGFNRGNLYEREELEIVI